MSTSTEVQNKNEEKQTNNETQNYKTIVEGTATMTYPSHQEEAVFYNPVQVQNRDLSILMISLYAERRRKRFLLKHYKQKLRRDEKITDPQELQNQLQQYEASLDNNDNNDIMMKQPQDEEEDPSSKQQQQQQQEGLTIFEALAASGLRSIRYWKEIPGIKHITINDLDPKAVERAHVNLTVNELTHVVLEQEEDYVGIPHHRPYGIRVRCGDATQELYTSRRQPGLRSLKTEAQRILKEQWDVIDLDPYGSAVPFLDAAMQAITDGGLLCVTCTDMAALGGSHPETAYGRYASMPIANAKYLQEMALRILLHTMAVTAAKYGRTIKPILSVGMAFYVRVFVEVNNDKAGVNDLSLKIGSVYQSTQCPSFHTVPHGLFGQKEKRIYTPARAPIVPQCEETGGPFKVGGPIWLAPLNNEDVVETALKRLESSSVPDLQWLATKSRMHGLLTSVSEELQDVPLYYTLPDLCHAVSSSSPPLNTVKAAIVNAGYRVSGYHKEPQAIKTDAPNRIVWDIMRAWCQKNPPKGTSKKKKNKNGNHAADKILAVEPSIQVDFAIPEGFHANKKKATRFPLNPEKHWGPKAASGMFSKKRKAEDQSVK